MHRLKDRLRKLETRLDTKPSWNDYFAHAERLAQSRQSPADRELTVDAIHLMKERGRDTWTEAHRSVWERWRAGFDQAVVELRVPYSMLVEDAWL